MSLARAFEQRAEIVAAATTSANHGRSRSSPLSRWPGQQRNQSTPLLGGSGQAGGAAPGTGNITGVPGSRPFKRLTAAEMTERREKGLCFNCDDKFTPGHRWRSFCIEVIYDDEAEDHLPAEPDNDPHVSLHALTGICAGRTMQLFFLNKGRS